MSLRRLQLRAGRPSRGARKRVAFVRPRPSVQMLEQVPGGYDAGYASHKTPDTFSFASVPQCTIRCSFLKTGIIFRNRASVSQKSVCLSFENGPYLPKTGVRPSQTGVHPSNVGTCLQKMGDCLSLSVPQAGERRLREGQRRFSCGIGLFLLASPAPQPASGCSSRGNRCYLPGTGIRLSEADIHLLETGARLPAMAAYLPK